MRNAITALATAALLTIGSTALAGGWAVTSFENLPGEFEAGATYTLDYVILQHGQTPADSGASFVTFRNGKESLRFDGVNHGNGTYTAEVTIPAEGTWSWSVSSEGWGTHDLGTLHVAPAAESAGLGLMDAAKVILPLATLVAAILTLRSWTNTRAGSPRAETG
jgi:hypothetical protein